MNLSNRNVQNILNAISTVNHILNEQIKLYFVASKEPCPDCEYDPIRKQSQNSFCPTCGGDGWIEVESSISIPCSLEEDEEVGDIEITKIGEWKPKKIAVTIDIKEINDNKIDVSKIVKIEWQNTFFRIESPPKWGSLQGNLYEVSFMLGRL